jgi:hypothetical protein
VKAEDQYFIHIEKVWITREGNGIVECRHLKTKEDHEYYKVVGREDRYVIYGASGRVFLPASLYETPLSGEGYFASGFVSKTRQYLREIDRTWFKYYDDAEEVLNNLVKFTLWAKRIPDLAIKTTIKKRLINQTKLLVRDVADTREVALIRTSATGLKVKNRKDLKPLARELADERDLKNPD